MHPAVFHPASAEHSLTSWWCCHVHLSLLSFVWRSSPGRWMLTNSMCDCFVTRVSGLLGCSCVSLSASWLIFVFSFCSSSPQRLWACAALFQGTNEGKNFIPLFPSSVQRFPCFHVILHAAHPRLANPQCLATRSLNLMPSQWLGKKHRLLKEWKRKKKWMLRNALFLGKFCVITPVCR